MQRSSARSRCKQQGIVSIETALIFPVLLFILVMFFELARIALVMTVVHTSLERAVQNLRQQDNFYAMGQSALSSLISQRVVDYSYDFISSDNVSVDMHVFSNLGVFSGTVSTGSDSDDEDTPEYSESPILNLTLTLKQDFITPLPELFDLGSSYQHDFQQVLGDLVIDDDDEDDDE